MDIAKLITKLPVGFAEDAAAMDGPRLRAEIIKAEEVIREMERELAADEKLQAAKQAVKDYGAGYREVRTAQRAKISYALHLMDERGELGTQPAAGES